MGKGDESVIDKGGAGDTGEEATAEETAGAEGADASNSSGEETQNGESEQAGGADSERGEEAGEAGEDGGEEAGAAGGEEGDDKPLSYTKAQFDQAVSEAVGEAIARHAEQSKAGAESEAPVKDLTDEEWTKKEEEWGMPRTAIKQVGQTAMKVFDAVSKMLDERLSRFERRDSIDALSREPGFSDAKALQPGIDQYMKEMGVPARLQSDPKILKAAAIYARGLGASKRVQKARTESEKNRKITGVARPAAGGAGKAKGGGSGLTPAQKAAAKLHPEGEAGYARDLKARGTAIAA